MRKLFTLLMLLAVAAGTRAQQANLALGRTATASSAAGSHTAAKAVDGNTTGDSRWESASTDDEWWQVDLGSVQEVDLIQIVWEGAYAESFRIVAATQQSLSDAVTVVERSGIALGGFPNTQNYTLAQPVQARYIRFEGVKRATPYGYSFYELGVYKRTEPVLTTLQLTAGAEVVALGTAATLTLTAQDQYGSDYALSELPHYAVSPAEAGTVDAEGHYTPLQNGAATLTATVQGVTSNAITIVGYEGANLAAASAVVATSDGAETATLAYAFDGRNEGGIWVLHAAQEDRAYEAWATLDLGAAYDLTLVQLAFEGASSAAYELLVSADNVTWQTAKTVTHPDGINAWNDYLAAFDAPVNGIRYVKFRSTRAATVYGIKLYEWAVYGVPADVTDGSLHTYQPDALGLVPLRGTLSTATVGVLNGAEGLAFDLTRVTIDGDGVGALVAPQNPNALLIVSSEQAAQLGDVSNLVVRQTDGWHADQLSLTDGYDVLTSLCITADRATFRRTLPAAGLATVMVPFGCAVPDGVKAYELLGWGDNARTRLTFGEVATLEAGRLYLLRSSYATPIQLLSNSYVQMDFTVGRIPTADGVTAYGTYQHTAAPEGSYVLGTDGLFHQTAAGATLPAFHGCVALSTLAAPQLSISLGGATTGLAPATLQRSRPHSYTLDGRRVEHPRRGVYVINGKKVVMK